MDGLTGENGRLFGEILEKTAAIARNILCDRELLESLQITMRLSSHYDDTVNDVGENKSF